jgi:hypothetical protein
MHGESPQEIGFTIGAALGLAWWVYGTWGVPQGHGGGAGWIVMMICAGIGWLSGPYVAAAFAHLVH